MNVISIISPRAQEDIDRHADYIRAESIGAAERFVDRVRDTVGWLRDQPAVGKPREFRSGRLAGLRSWPVSEFPNHLLFYHANAERLLVVRVVHGARDLKQAFRNRGSRR